MPKKRPPSEHPVQKTDGNFQREWVRFFTQLSTMLGDDVSGTTDQITVTVAADGTITLSIPNPFTVPGVLNVTDNATFSKDVLFSGEGSGLLFGEIYAHDAADDIVLAAQDTFYQVTSFNANGLSNGVTPDHTNDHLTIVTAGKYLANVTISAHSHAANDYEFEVYKNNGNTGFDNLHVHRTTSVAGAIGSATMTGIIDLAANDTIEVWVQRTDGGAVSKTITIDHISLSLIKIGGT